MLYVDGNNIKLTRGDTAYLQVPIENKLPDGSTVPYELAANDTLTMTMRATYDSEVCFQKVLKGSNTFHILPEDTCGCKFGKYKYDVQLTMANGDVFTVVEPTCFQVLPEVTCE